MMQKKGEIRQPSAVIGRLIYKCIKWQAAKWNSRERTAVGRKKLFRLIIAFLAALIVFFIYSVGKTPYPEDQQVTVHAVYVPPKTGTGGFGQEATASVGKVVLPDNRQPGTSNGEHGKTPKPERGNETAQPPDRLKPSQTEAPPEAVGGPSVEGTEPRSGQTNGTSLKRDGTPEPALPGTSPGTQTRTLPESVKSGSQQPKRIALTFDDGPDSTYTPLVLEVLKKHNVKATFFVVGVQIAKHEEILKQIIEEGHTLGNHTWEHAKLTESTPEQIHEQIERVDKALQTSVGITTRLFRPPYGAADERVSQLVAQSGYHMIKWNSDTRDWAGTPPKEMLELVKEQAKPGGIILMHSFGGKDGKLDNTIQALPPIIKYLRNEGYTLVTVDELLND